MKYRVSDTQLRFWIEKHQEKDYDTKMKNLWMMLREDKLTFKQFKHVAELFVEKD